MPSQAFFEFMEQTMFELTRLLGSQDESLTLSRATEEQVLGQRIFLGREEENGCSVVLSWVNRTSEPIQPCVLAWFAMRAVSQLLLNTCDIPFEAENQWFPDDLGQGYHTPVSLAEYLYEDTCRRVEQAYEFITRLRFRLMNRLADMTYESEALRGKLAFFPENPPDGGCFESNDFFVRFASDYYVPLEEEKLKQIRKLLAGAGTKALCFTHNQDQGIYICQGYLRQDTNSFPVCVSFERGSWVLYLHGYPLFQVRAHQLKVIDDPIKRALSALKDEFELAPFAIVLYRAPLEAIRNQSHGSSLIFLDFAQEFSKDWMNALVRRGRALPIDGLHMVKEEEGSDPDWDGLTKLGRMDGAFVADIHSSSVLYLSTIVDGLAITKGLPDAGARRNSIYTWVANLVYHSLPPEGDGVSIESPPKVVAVTFSEDGNMDIFQGKTILRSLLQEKDDSRYVHPFLRVYAHQ